MQQHNSAVKWISGGGTVNYSGGIKTGFLRSPNVATLFQEAFRKTHVRGAGEIVMHTFCPQGESCYVHLQFPLFFSTNSLYFHISHFIISQVPLFVSFESKQLIFLKSANKLTLSHP